MTNLKRGTHREPQWSGGSAFTTARSVTHFSAAGGLLVAGGDHLYVCPPGGSRFVTYTPPTETTPITAVAAEGQPPFRFAAASRGFIDVFGGPMEPEPMARMTLSDPTTQVTHLAWANLGGERVLYYRGSDAVVGRIRFRETDAIVEALDLPHVLAITSDVGGVLSAMSVENGEVDIVLTPDGEASDTRFMAVVPADVDDPELELHMAVAGEAVGYSTDATGTDVSWAVGEDFLACQKVWRGPIAFHTHGPESALFGVRRFAQGTEILRETRAGVVTHLHELVIEGDAEPPQITALAWDPTRRMLWIASPQVGILWCREPGAPVMLS